jgi:predicted N-acetyltransferase YhbS
MDIRSYQPDEAPRIASLFQSVFEHSEGAQEGQLIGELARQLMTRTEPEDLFVFVGVTAGEIVGAVFFTRMPGPQDPDVFLLAPMAVRTDHQGEGIGQALIHYAIGELKQKGVRTIVTYGDPGFYRKVGFQQIDEAMIQPPLPLSQPEGWLAQTPGQTTVQKIVGPCSCVEALNDPAYW